MGVTSNENPHCATDLGHPIVRKGARRPLESGFCQRGGSQAELAFRISDRTYTGWQPATCEPLVPPLAGWIKRFDNFDANPFKLGASRQGSNHEDF
mmetsp:Transcript_95936/g.173127  ORF Transcript_95936/g.173127 Transcript_95936/m.173127 type:complete len:96 (-) Transcript_95936:365-652(-)